MGIVSINLRDGAYKCYDTLAGVANPLITSVSMNANGVWAGSDHGLFRFFNDKWEHYTFKTENNQAINTIQSIYSDRFERVWAIARNHSSGQAIIMFDGNNWTQLDESMSGKDIEYNRFFASSRGDIFICGRGPGLENYVLQYRDNTYILWSENEGILQGSAKGEISTIAEDSSGNVIIAGKSGYSVFAGGAGWEFKQNWGGLWTEDNKDSLHSNINILKVAPDGTIWAVQKTCLAGSYYQSDYGIFRFRNGIWEKFNCFSPAITDETGVLIIDFAFAGNNLRLFTEIGILDYNPDTGFLKKIELPAGTNLSFVESQYHYGNYYDFIMCREYGNFTVNFLRPSIWTYQNGQWKEYELNIDPQYLNFSNITFINDTVWFCNSTGAGLMRFDGKTWKTIEMQDGLPDNYVNCIDRGKDGSLWAVHKGGYVTNITGDKMTVHDLRIDSFDFTSYEQLAVDSTGHIWLSGVAGHYKGSIQWIDRQIVSEFDGSKWKTHETGSDTAFGSSYRGYRSMLVDSKNKLYLTTYPSYPENSDINIWGGLYTYSNNIWYSYDLYRDEYGEDEPFCKGIALYRDTLVLAGLNELNLFFGGCHCGYYSGFPIDEAVNLGKLANTTSPNVLNDGTLAFRAFFKNGSRYIFYKDGNWSSRKDIKAPNGINQAPDGSIWFYSGKAIVKIENLDACDVDDTHPDKITGNFRIYPLPATECLNIEPTEHNRGRYYSARLYNALGMEVWKKESLSDIFEINTSAFAGGRYILVMIWDNSVESYPINIVH